MAKRTTITVTDDLDGTEAAETVSFGLDGTSYEIDLSKKNASALRKALAPYVEKGVKVSAGRRRKASASGTGAGQARLIREWAREQGLDVPERGRIPAEIRAAYEAGH